MNLWRVVSGLALWQRVLLLAVAVGLLYVCGATGNPSAPVPAHYSASDGHWYALK